MIEVQCRATCTYCGKQETFFAEAIPKSGFLVIDDHDLPNGWHRGFRYMSEEPTTECEKCSQESHY